MQLFPHAPAWRFKYANAGDSGGLMICNKEGESSIDAQVQEKGRGALSMVLIEVHTKQAKIIKNIYTDPALTFSGFKMAI